MRRAAGVKSAIIRIPRKYHLPIATRADISWLAVEIILKTADFEYYLDIKYLSLPLKPSLTYTVASTCRWYPHIEFHRGNTLHCKEKETYRAISLLVWQMIASHRAIYLWFIQWLSANDAHKHFFAQMKAGNVVAGLDKDAPSKPPFSDRILTKILT